MRCSLSGQKFRLAPGQSNRLLRLAVDQPQHFLRCDLSQFFFSVGKGDQSQAGHLIIGALIKADQNDIENLATLLVAAGCNYIMGVPQGDDCMLMYQCTGYHEAASLREIFGLRPIKEFDQWLEKMGFSENGKLTPLAGDASVFLK